MLLDNCMNRGADLGSGIVVISEGCVESMAEAKVDGSPMDAVMVTRENILAARESPFVGEGVVGRLAGKS